MLDTQRLPVDVLPCPSGDVILIPRALLAIRLTPEQQLQLAARFPALGAPAGNPS
ncbi:hypothetical protein [Streptosporangium sp. NPDC049078]|uniref:hypothetical protein n=1 Tax=Streptosporangium sp. NPDC049078 TaxID=3155767 RepID=UPI003429F578